MKRKFRILVLSGILSTVVIAPVSGQFFGFGMPVYDGAVNLEQLTQTIKLIAQLEQLKETYVKVKAHYDEAMRQAQYIRGMSGRYRSPLVIWRGITASDTYGRNGRWVSAVNSGADASGGWLQATSRLVAYPGGFGGIAVPQQDRKRLEVGALELSDGVSIGTIDTIGRVRAAGPSTEGKLMALEADSLSDSADLNVLAAQLNKSNAIALIQVKEQTNANKISAAQTELALIRLRQEREAAAYAVASDVAFRTDGRTAMRASFDGATGFGGYRIP